MSKGKGQIQYRRNTPNAYQQKQQVAEYATAMENRNRLLKIMISAIIAMVVIPIILWSVSYYAEVRIPVWISYISTVVLGVVTCLMVSKVIGISNDNQQMTQMLNAYNNRKKKKKSGKNIKAA